MTNRARTRKNIVGFLSILILSAATMLWLFWHHPVSTGLVTLAVLAGLGISAKLSRAADNDVLSDMLAMRQSLADAEAREST